MILKHLVMLRWVPSLIVVHVYVPIHVLKALAIGPPPIRVEASETLIPLEPVPVMAVSETPLSAHETSISTSPHSKYPK